MGFPCFFPSQSALAQFLICIPRTLFRHCLWNTCVPIFLLTLAGHGNQPEQVAWAVIDVVNLRVFEVAVLGVVFGKHWDCRKPLGNFALVLTPGGGDLTVITATPPGAT
jgi:hypothetical protein